MSRAFSLAGFEVTLIGRFWVTTEGRTCGGSTLELPNFSVEGLRWFVKASLPYFLTLMVRQLGKPAAREFQEFPVLVVYVCPARLWGQFFARQQLRNIRIP